MDRGKSIAINMETDEMQKIAELLVESYLTNNLRQFTPQRVVIFKQLKKIAMGSVQYIAIMISLVGANLLTKIFEAKPFFANNHEVQFPRNSSSVLKNCPHDFGCELNVCWKLCNKISDKVNISWCHTSPNPQKREYQ